MFIPANMATSFVLASARALAANDVRFRSTKWDLQPTKASAANIPRSQVYRLKTIPFCRCGANSFAESFGARKRIEQELSSMDCLPRDRDF
jgi:hypothetical protein